MEPKILSYNAGLELFVAKRYEAKKVELEEKISRLGKDSLSEPDMLDFAALATLKEISKSSAANLLYYHRDADYYDKVDFLSDNPAVHDAITAGWKVCEDTLQSVPGNLSEYVKVIGNPHIGNNFTSVLLKPLLGVIEQQVADYDATCSTYISDFLGHAKSSLNADAETQSYDAASTAPEDKHLLIGLRVAQNLAKEGPRPFINILAHAMTPFSVQLDKSDWLKLQKATEVAINFYERGDPQAGESTRSASQQNVCKRREALGIIGGGGLAVRGIFRAKEAYSVGEPVGTWYNKMIEGMICGGIAAFLLGLSGAIQNTSSYLDRIITHKDAIDVLEGLGKIAISLEEAKQRGKQI